MLHKQFAERFNKALDAIEMPVHPQERLELVARMFRIPRFKANMLLKGANLPDPVLLEAMADVLEVKPEWLTGKEVGPRVLKP